jgi:hypothetical protein
MLAERLAALGPTDPAPAWDQLVDGTGDVGAAIADLPAELVAPLSEALVGSWDAIDGEHRAAALHGALGRLRDLEDPLAFAATLDRLTPAVVAAGDEAPEQLQETCAALVRARIETDREGQQSPSETRARLALGAWADLVCADVTSPYRLLADLDRLRGKMPADLASSAARAAGRLADYRDDDVLEAVMRAALAIDDAVVDASVELGHHNVRLAARAGTADAAVALLRAAGELYAEAAAHEEMRPDATAYGAAVELTLAFLSGADAEMLAEPADRMVLAAREMRAHLDDEGPSRAWDPLAAWLTLAARLRGAAERMEGQGLLDLRAALLSLLDLYADSRLRILGLEQTSPDLQIVIGPRIERWVSENPLTREALLALRDELGDSSAMYAPLTRLLEVTEDPGRARWSRFPPGSPGFWALGSCPRTTRRQPHAR